MEFGVAGNVDTPIYQGYGDAITIEDRIRFYEIMRRKYNDEKDILEERLNRYNEKITYHMLAIINLEKKRGGP